MAYIYENESKINISIFMFVFCHLVLDLHKRNFKCRFKKWLRYSRISLGWNPCCKKYLVLLMHVLCYSYMQTLIFLSRIFEECFDYYRESPHRASSHSTDFSIVRFLKNIHSSHSTSINFSIVLFCAILLYYILIVRISHSTVFWCSTLTVLWGDFL